MSTTARAMLIDDLMQSEAAGIESILSPTENIEEVYDDFDRNPDLDVEEALGFAYLVDDNEEKDIMESLNKLYSGGMSLAEIKKAMKDWQDNYFLRISIFNIHGDYQKMSDAVKEYKEFIANKRASVKKSNQTSFIIKDRLSALDEIEKCMDYHLDWGFTTGIVKKFEKKNKKVTKIQSLHRGNKDRRTVEKSHKWYQDTTSHWKKKNKSKVKEELIKTMIEEDMSEARKATLMSEIDDFMKERFQAKKKKTKRKKKSKRKKSKRKKSKSKKKSK